MPKLKSIGVNSLKILVKNVSSKSRSPFNCKFSKTIYTEGILRKEKILNSFQIRLHFVALFYPFLGPKMWFLFEPTLLGPSLPVNEH